MGNKTRWALVCSLVSLAHAATAYAGTPAPDGSLELDGDALSIKAINNLEEVACLNLGHFWFETLVLGPDVLVTVESTDPT